MTRRFPLVALTTASALVLASCGGGGGGGDAAGTPTPGTPTTPVATSLYAVPAAEALSAAEVSTIVAQAVAEAQARSQPAVISVVDRVGNVLAVYVMNGAPTVMRIPPPPGGGQSFDVQNLMNIPAGAGAIAKAVTAAYLSSSGNAFTSRTASDIVQENFPVAPNTVGLESGPLFGVQFSSLPCSDLNRRFGDGTIGPKRSPLGLAGDPGSVPLYKNGVVVGGIGVMSDGVYTVDSNATNDDDDEPEEYIALAGSRGFEAPETIRANRVSIDGTLLSFIDAKPANLRAAAGTLPALASAGTFPTVIGYFAGGAPIAGTPYGTPASGYRLVTAAERSAGTAIDNPDALLVVDAAGNNRYPIRAGTDGGEVAQPLTAAEVKAIAEEAFTIMTRARGAIRQPLDSRMQATISIVDTHGQVLAIQRSPDAPVFGTDVSLQKARSAAFLSNPKAAADLLGSGSADVAGFVQKLRDFVGNQSALTGGVAYAERPIGLLARPYFPDGQVGTPNGPLSRPIASFSPFSTGLQSALILGNLVQQLGEVTGGPAVPRRCTTLPAFDSSGGNRLENGLQIFPGGEPIYRGTTLVGAIGVSGDGIDQDDMVSFLGVFNGGARVGTVGHAARDMRISAIPFRQANNAFLPYVQCPVAPFLDTSEQNVCEGK